MLYEKARIPFLEGVRSESSKEIETVRHHVETSLNELIHRQNLILAGFLERKEKGEELSALLSQTETGPDELNGRLERRRADLEREKQLALGDLTHIGRAWILPSPERPGCSGTVVDKEIERIAMGIAMDYKENVRKWKPEHFSRSADIA